MLTNSAKYIPLRRVHGARGQSKGGGGMEGGRGWERPQAQSMLRATSRRKYFMRNNLWDVPLKIASMGSKGKEKNKRPLSHLRGNSSRPTKVR